MSKKSFWKSKHKLTYIIIAFTYFTSPSHVYKLAHECDEIRNNVDQKIINALKKKKIIGQKHSHHP